MFGRRCMQPQPAGKLSIKHSVDESYMMDGLASYLNLKAQRTIRIKDSGIVRPLEYIFAGITHIPTGWKYSKNARSIRQERRQHRRIDDDFFTIIQQKDAP